ncbi:Rib/alpha-like domain-containing protein [uncultured Corynebacterium sp.]|uniref:Rib/alpha-like domain-containing protein n=1 Tax=uncultured Corynebacterium sp. TaxID=159447 RepID=UPI0025E8C2D5|nr:Rib/alpha-like domain-containing protein [uncultured Corynebacterium sp.]
MTGKHDRAFARRRGTSVAACALGLSLVVTGVQPVATPQAAPQASAQLLDRTEADKSLVSYLGTTAVRYGETTSVSPNTNALTVHPPTGYKLVEGVNPGWGAEVDPATGELSITPDSNAELPETDTIHVEFTFGDGSTKVVDAEISLEPAPVYVDQSDKVYWTGKEINPVDIRVNRAAYASKLEIDDSTLPEGITATPRNFGNIKHIFLKGTPTETGTFEVKTQLVEGENVVVGADGPLEQTFTITVKDSADLPAPVEENIVEDPARVKPGESVDIAIPTENASSVEVTDLPEGLTYDSEKSKIAGKPKASGKAKVDIITNDAKVITDTIDIQVEESGGSTTPATTTPEDSTPSPTTTTEQTTDATTPAIPTSGRLTTQPAPTTSAQPTTTKPTTAKPAPSVDDFAWDELTVQAGTTKVAVPARKPSQTVNVSVEGDAPEWLSVASDGQVVAEPGRDVEPRAYPVDVVSEAGERYTITVEVTAPVSDADRISDEEYKDTYVQAGKTNSSRTPIASIDRDGIEYEGQPLPAGTKFSTDSPEGNVNPDTGVVTVKAPLRTPAGETITIPVDFTYPDGTKGKADAVFRVDAGAQNEAYKPAYQEGLGAQPGKTVVVPLLDGTFPVNKDGENIGQYALAPVYDDKGNELGTAKAYKGWDVSIDPDTGAIYAAAPEENPEPIEVPVRVLYSDGTVSDKDGEPTVFAHIAALTGPSLADSTEAAGYGKPFFDADGNIRMFPTGSMPPGATFEQTGLTALPVEIDPETGAITVKVPEDAPVGADFDIPLKLTLPDGSVQEITVPVATQSEAASQVVSWRPVQVTEAGTPVTVAPSQAPAGATYALAASFDADGWQASVDPKTGAITAARNGDEEDPQATLIPVVVTFADGSQRVVEVPATTVRGTAALTRVEYPRVTINAGQIAILRPNVAGASFSLIKPIPGLRTKVDPETGELTVASYDGTVPGPRDIPVQVTFEDSSHTITSARVEVRTKSGKGTLAESTMLNDVSAVGRPDSTTRVTLPVPKKATDQPFSLGEFDADGWEVSLDRARGVLDVHVPANAAGRVKEIPVNVLFADGSTGQFKVSVEVDGVAAGGSSQSNEGSSKPSPWVWALAVLGLLGAAGKVLYDNRENFQHFLERWM